MRKIEKMLRDTVKMRRGIFGKRYFLDGDGRTLGYAKPKPFGGYLLYDETGKKLGSSVAAGTDRFDHTDTEGRTVGYSIKNRYGGYTQFLGGTAVGRTSSDRHRR